MKFFIKSLTILLFALFIFSVSKGVQAWFSINRQTTVTVEGFTDPYWIDILFDCDEVTMLSNADLENRLPTSYHSLQYINALNGYIDEEGYASLRLYGPKDRYFQQLPNDSITVGYYLDGEISLKIAIVLSDGGLFVSPSFIATKFYTNIKYDAFSLDIEEADQIGFSFPYEVRLIDKILDVIPLTILGPIGLILGSLFILYLIGYRDKRILIRISAINFTVVALLSGLFILVEILGSSLYPFAVLSIVSVITVFESMYLAHFLRNDHPAKIMVYVFIINIAFIITTVHIHL